ncbi:hypothetical protein GO599_13065 [Sulfolobus islandicus]|uniref:NurA domain-containing protein n=1 Tax=Saccharolobus islandicus (strain HVE10/4) TaxID=930943 RepID=F0NRB8_SACI0|nr:hypothetical protein [Sulfolobus islandicus]ADX82919.1 conserved hypothetical protein [Sulfolobus islandicus HVE10/4]WCM38286.1 hypothetical protein GO599_13065 [Sulfolobus islandicus]
MAQSSTFKVENLKQWFKNTVHQFPNLGLADDDPEEQYVAQYTVKDSELLDIIRLSSLDKLQNDLIFIDGVMRYRVVGAIEVQGVYAPLVIAHLIAGAMKLSNRELIPLQKKELISVVFPFAAASRRLGYSIIPARVTPIEFSRFGSLFRNSNREIIFSDTTITLGEYRDQNGQFTHRPLINENEMIASSKIISTAKNRIKELLRTLELYLLIETSKSTNNKLIIADGPIAPLFKYIGLIDPNLRGVVRDLRDARNAKNAYDILKNVVGVVKKVAKIPESLTINFNALSGDAYLYLWTRLIEDQEAEGREDNYLSTYILSALFRLREELLFENYPVFSPTSGLIRVDVPLPVIMSGSEWINWITCNSEEISDQGKNDIKQIVQSTGRNKLTNLLNTIYSLRYPIPSSTPYRNLVELYPIKEVEDWLKSCLLSKYELASLTLS